VIGANAVISKLQKKLKAKDVEIDNLRESLSSSKNQASKTDNQLRALRAENAPLRQSLQATTARLNELEGFAKELHEEDEEVW
jgi:chromosome segregation ATPase